jgi:hypothetical protein
MQVGLTKFGYKLEKEVVVTLMSKYGNFTQLFASKSRKNWQNFPKGPLPIPFFFFSSHCQMVKTCQKKNPGKKSRKRGKSGQISIFEF